MKKSPECRLISVEAGHLLPKPIELMLSGTESCADVRIGRGATAVIYDTSSSDEHCVNVRLEPESTLTYISLSSGSARTFRSTVGEGASIFWHCTTIGDTRRDHSLISTCTGPHARSDIDWIFSVSDTERQNVNVRNIFAARIGGGEITLKGVAQQKAHAVCNGMIEITEQGTGTDTYLTEDVLMLDASARVDAIPALEIRTNDVKASHSATVSRVTVEDLFYFQSRGIDAADARMMFVEGFLCELTERIAQKNIRLEVQKALKFAY